MVVILEAVSWSCSLPQLYHYNLFIIIITFEIEIKRPESSRQEEKQTE